MSMESDIYILEKPNKLILKCAVPAVITSVFGAIYAVIDGIFVGRYLGECALASINLIMPIIMIVESLSNMIATGASVNISMLLGEKNRETASDIFSWSIKIIIGFSCIIGLAGFIFSRQFIGLIAPGANSEAVECAIGYLRVFAIFAPVIPIYFAMDNYLRVCGRQKLSMAVGIFSQVANVVLDYIFIVVLRLGIESAALASCISIAAGSVYMLVFFSGKKRDVYYTSNSIQIIKFLHIVANGSSEFFSNISMSVMSVILNLFLLKYGGTTAIAAFSIVMYVDSIIGMVNFGICDSIQPAISYCYGAKLYERLTVIFRKVIIIVIIVSVAAFLFMFFAGPATALLFVKEADYKLIEVSYVAIKIFSFSYLAGWIDMCFSSLFTAIDKPVQSLMISMFGSLIFPLVFLIILSFLMGLNGVWTSFAVSSAASGIVALFLYRRGKRCGYL